MSKTSLFFAAFAVLSIFVELSQILRTNDAWNQSKLGPKCVGGWNGGFKGIDTYCSTSYKRFWQWNNANQEKKKQVQRHIRSGMCSFNNKRKLEAQSQT